MRNWTTGQTRYHLAVQPQQSTMMGRQFQIMIGLVKCSLHKTIGNAYLIWNELQDVLLDVEVTLNNRPKKKMSICHSSHPTPCCLHENAYFLSQLTIASKTPILGKQRSTCGDAGIQFGKVGWQSTWEPWGKGIISSTTESKPHTSRRRRADRVREEKPRAVENPFRGKGCNDNRSKITTPAKLHRARNSTSISNGTFVWQIERIAETVLSANALEFKPRREVAIIAKHRQWWTEP